MQSFEKKIKALYKRVKSDLNQTIAKVDNDIAILMSDKKQYDDRLT